MTTGDDESFGVDGVFSLDEAARFFSCSKRTIQRRVDAELLEARTNPLTGRPCVCARECRRLLADAEIHRGAPVP